MRGEYGPESASRSEVLTLRRHARRWSTAEVEVVGAASAKGAARGLADSLVRGR